MENACLLVDYKNYLLCWPLWFAYVHDEWYCKWITILHHSNA